MQAPFSREQVGLRLRAVRRALGYAEHPNKKKFAKILNADVNTVNRWLQGENYPRPEAIYALKPFGVDWNFIYDGTMTGVHESLRPLILQAMEEDRGIDEV